MNLDVLLELEKKKHFRWMLKDSASRGLGLMTLILVVYVGFAESVGASEKWRQVDKAMHFMIFGGFTLMFLQYARFKLFPNMQTGLRLFLIFFLLTCIGVVAELSHLFVPQRTFEMNDMFANLAGTFTVGIPVILITPLRRKTDQFTCFQESDHYRQGEQQCLKVRRRSRNH
jgi:VanZ family protein